MKTERATMALPNLKEITFMKLLRTGISLLFCTQMVSSPIWAETKVSGDVEVGYQKRDVSANESKFEEYGETPDGAVIPHLQVDVNTDSDTVRFEGSNIRQNNQSYDLNYNHDYKLKVEGLWDQFPHDYSNVARTVYNASSPGVLALPDQLQTDAAAAASRTAYNNLLANYWAGAHDVKLGIQDNKGTVNLGLRPTQNVRVDFGISEERIEGTKLLAPYTSAGSGASSFTTLIQLPSPVERKVYNMHAGTQYGTKDLQLGFNYLMSAFNNDVEAMTWDNPRSLTDALSLPAQGRMALAPDNWSHTFTLNGGVNLPGSTRLTATGSMGYLRQNEALLPFTTNTAQAATALTNGAKPSSTASLAEQTANAKMLTWTQDYKVSNRIWKPMTLSVHYHSYQLMNRTAEVDFAGRSTTDGTFSAGPFTNSRFEFRKDTLEGGADYQIFTPLSLGIKYATEWDHRTDREVNDTTEKSLTASADYTPLSWTLLRGSYLRAHRRPQDFDASAFLDATGTTFSETPGLRRYDVADRLRNQGKVLMQLNPGPVTADLNGSLTHDNFQPGAGDLSGNTTLSSVNFPATMYGLVENRDGAAGADLGWSFSDRLGFDVYYDYEESRTLQRSNFSTTETATTLQNPTANWEARISDTFHTAGVGATVGRPADRVTYRFGYDFLRSREAVEYINIGSAVSAPAINGVTTTGSLVEPQNTKYTKQDISVRSNIKLSDRVSLILSYVFEKYDVTDWQYQNLPLVGGTSIAQSSIFLGTNLQNYIAHIGTVLLKYKF